MEAGIGLGAWVLGILTGVLLGTIGLLLAVQAVFDELRTWVQRRRKAGKVTYYPPENRFTQEQGVKAYRLTRDEWILRYLGSQPIYDWKLMLLDIETSHVLAVSTGEDCEELVRTYLREAPKHETPLEPHKIAVVPVWGSKYPTPWGRET